MGRRHNQQAGISPLKWLTDFATSLNSGVRGADNAPLPLHAPGPCGPGKGAGAGVGYEDGEACPSLKTFLHLTVTSLHLHNVPVEDLQVGWRVWEVG